MGKLKRWSEFLTAKEVVDGDIVTILGEPELRTAEETGFYNDVYTIKVLCPDGEERDWTLNKTTYNKLYDTYGDEGKDWIKRKVVVKKTQQNVRGNMKDVLYGEPYQEPVKTSGEQYTMDEILKRTESWDEKSRAEYIKMLKDEGKIAPP